MAEKTYATAVVLIPPDELQGPIQAIRRAHDRHVRRWMPHVTLIYPFRPQSMFDGLYPLLRDACQATEPFEISLARFRQFHHGRGSCTIWLDAEPNEPIVALQSALQSVVPDCDEQDRYKSGFTPHLSVGQVRGRESLHQLIEQLQPTGRRLPGPFARWP